MKTFKDFPPGSRVYITQEQLITYTHDSYRVNGSFVVFTILSGNRIGFRKGELETDPSMTVKDASDPYVVRGAYWDPSWPCQPAYNRRILK